MQTLHAPQLEALLEFGESLAPLGPVTLSLLEYSSSWSERESWYYGAFLQARICWRKDETIDADDELEKPFRRVPSDVSETGRQRFEGHLRRHS